MPEKPIVHGRKTTREVDYYYQYVVALDDPRLDLTDYEIGFIEKMLTYFPETLSEKQIGLIRRMAKQYLGEDVD
jgi:hypothetical protein